MPKVKPPAPKCGICWGKGFSTRLWGNTVALGDFEGDRPLYIAPRVEVKFCKCLKGQRMKAAKRLATEIRLDDPNIRLLFRPSKRKR